jgi:DNA polymerase-3 subunit epsilon
MELAVIDLETTGFSPDSGDRIIEIGIVFLNSRLEHVRTFETLINPECSVSHGVHGITATSLAASPTFSQVFDTLLGELCRTSCLVAHNVSFELKFLKSEFGLLGSRLPKSLQHICTMKAARELGVGSNQKLPTLVKEMGIAMTGPSHRALPDALATAELLRRLAISSYPLPPLMPVEWSRTDGRDILSRPPQSHRGSGLRSPSDPGLTGHSPSKDGTPEDRFPANGESAVSELSRPIQILLEKLAQGGTTARKAAQSLESQARRHGSKMEPAVGVLVPYLYHDPLELRTDVAAVLGHIGTANAVSALAKAFEETSSKDLAADIDGDKAHFLFAYALAQNESKLSAKALLRLLASRTLPDFAKGSVMDILSGYDFEDLGVKLPDNLTETLERFAESDDPQVVEGALSLLGKM